MSWGNATSKMLYVKAFIDDVRFFFSFRGRIICRTIVFHRWPAKRTVPQIIYSFVVLFSFSIVNMEVSAQDESLNKALFCSSNTGCWIGESIAHFHTLRATFCLHFWFNLQYTHDLRLNEKMKMNFTRLFYVDCLDTYFQSILSKHLFLQQNRRNLSF